MQIRRAAAWLSTVVVAAVVALAVPVAQLRTVLILKACCCPNPDDCHCPDHQPDSSGEPSMHSCHNTERALVSPQMPAFQEPDVAAASAPAPVVIAIAHAIPAPHQAPPPTRPDAPS